MALLDAVIAQWDVRREGDMVFHPDGLEQIVRRMTRKLLRFHEENPLLIGMSRTQFLRDMGAGKTAEPILAVLLSNSDMKVDGQYIKLDGHGVQFTKAQRQKIQALLRELDEQPFTPPGYKEIVRRLGDEAILRTLVAQQDVVLVPPDVVLLPRTYTALVDYARTVLEGGEVLSLAALRDHFGSARRVVMPFLDLLAAKGITRRTDAGHVLHESDWARVHLDAL
jgi:hypothetical protein